MMSTLEFEKDGETDGSESKESKTSSSVNSAALSASGESASQSEWMTSKDSAEAKPKRSRLTVIILLFLILGLLAGLGAVIYFNYFHKPSEKNSTVCSSPKCVQLAHQLKNWGDPKVDPCVDFYKFSCGRFVEHNMAPDTHSSYQKTDSARKRCRQARNWKQSCEHCTPSVRGGRESRKQQQASLESSMAGHIRSLGTAPALVPPDNTTQDSYAQVAFDLNDWLVKLAKLPAVGAAPFFDPRVSKKLIIHAPPHGFRSSVETLNQTLSRMFANDTTFLANRDLIADDVQEAMSLDQRISNMAGTAKRMVPFAKLLEKVKGIDFEMVISASLGLDQSQWAALSKSALVADSKLFFGEDDNLQKVIESTPTRVLATYIILKHIDAVLVVAKLQTDSKTDCELIVSKIMPQAVLQTLIRSHKHEENIGEFSKLLGAVKGSYVEMFESADWLSGPSRENSRRKVEVMAKTVDYPNEEAVSELYEKANIAPTDSWLTMIDKVTRAQTSNEIKNIIAPSPSDFSEIVGPFTNFVDDHLAITVAILNDPNFNATYPKYARIATAGTVLAHEMGHGFDGEGVRLSADGELNGLMTAEEAAKFEEKGKCLVEQYANYEDPEYGKGLPAANAFDDLIADNLGAVAAWKTHKSFDMSKEPDVVGFVGKDVDKMFFHIAALDFCAPPMSIPKDQVAQMTSPTHSFRVNGPFANMESFAKTFGCKSGTAMNPSKKCEIF